MPVASAVLGFPRMGRDRELKKITERYWSAKATQAELLSTAAALRLEHWQLQKAAGVDVIASNDFALYDQVLDHSLLFNAIPPRYQGLGLDAVDTAFAMGRGLQRPAKGDQPKIDVPSQGQPHARAHTAHSRGPLHRAAAAAAPIRQGGVRGIACRIVRWR